MNNYGPKARRTPQGKRPALRLACALLAAPATVGAQVVEVRVAAQEALAPKWVHARTHVSGICPDVLAALERVEPRLRFVGYRRSRSLPGIEAGLASGSLDAACALVESPRRRAIARQVEVPVYMVPWCGTGWPRAATTRPWCATPPTWCA